VLWRPVVEPTELVFSYTFIYLLLYVNKLLIIV